MRRIVVVLVPIVLAAGLPAAAGAADVDIRRYQTVGTQSLSLVNGTGWAVLHRTRGAVIGRVRRGWVKLVVPSGWVRSPAGCEGRRRPSTRTVVCWGWHLSFLSSRASWIVASGRGINVSAAMRGTVRLKGRRGTYSIAGRTPRRWPTRARTFYVGD